MIKLFKRIKLTKFIDFKVKPIIQSDKVLMQYTRSKYISNIKISFAKI